MTVVALPANQPETFYRGAGRIGAFRGVDGLPARPEDWVGSVTPRFGLAPSGLSTLPDGRLLADAVEADRAYWLGPDRTEPGVLVKLLDAGERLPVHVHPDRGFAASHLASAYGKTEAWVIVEARPDAFVHVGFSRDVSEKELADWVERQDVDALLGATNRLPVAAGDAILCPAGAPHAIGDGILLVEVQEPSDFSVMLERFGLPGGDLGLGYDVALQCVDRSAWDADRLAALRGDGDSLLPAAAGEFFSAARVRAGASITGFSVLIVIDGQGRLRGEHDDLPVRRGDTLLVPYASGPLSLDGDASVIRLAAGSR
jgi:mannose-6-phosphate isomerase